MTDDQDLDEQSVCLPLLATSERNEANRRMMEMEMSSLKIVGDQPRLQDLEVSASPTTLYINSGIHGSSMAETDVITDMIHDSLNWSPWFFSTMPKGLDPFLPTLRCVSLRQDTICVKEKPIDHLINTQVFTVASFVITAALLLLALFVRPLGSFINFELFVPFKLLLLLPTAALFVLVCVLLMAARSSGFMHQAVRKVSSGTLTAAAISYVLEVVLVAPYCQAYDAFSQKATRVHEYTSSILEKVVEWTNEKLSELLPQKYAEGMAAAGFTAALQPTPTVLPPPTPAVSSGWLLHNWNCTNIHPKFWSSFLALFVTTGLVLATVSICDRLYLLMRIFLMRTFSWILFVGRFWRYARYNFKIYTLWVVEFRSLWQMAVDQLIELLPASIRPEPFVKRVIFHGQVDANLVPDSNGNAYYSEGVNKGLKIAGVWNKGNLAIPNITVDLTRKQVRRAVRLYWNDLKEPTNEEGTATVDGDSGDSSFHPIIETCSVREKGKEPFNWCTSQAHPSFLVSAGDDYSKETAREAVLYLTSQSIRSGIEDVGCLGISMAAHGCYSSSPLLLLLRWPGTLIGASHRKEHATTRLRQILDHLALEKGIKSVHVVCESGTWDVLLEDAFWHSALLFRCVILLRWDISATWFRDTLYPRIRERCQRVVVYPYSTYQHSCLVWAFSRPENLKRILRVILQPPEKEGLLIVNWHSLSVSMNNGDSLYASTGGFWGTVSSAAMGFWRLIRESDIQLLPMQVPNAVVVDIAKVIIQASPYGTCNERSIEVVQHQFACLVG